MKLSLLNKTSSILINEAQAFDRGRRDLKWQKLSITNPASNA